jgi:hypothetical protein
LVKQNVQIGLVVSVVVALKIYANRLSEISSGGLMDFLPQSDLQIKSHFRYCFGLGRNTTKVYQKSRYDESTSYSANRFGR